ncbi:MAG: tripartite tricarboxylate transporter substrate-binding protein [Rubrivivax sp.]
MTLSRRSAASLLALGALAPAAAVRAADDYPARAVKLVVAYPPGQSTDIISRYLAGKLTEALGQTFYVENKGGVFGNLGTAYAARQPNDGYTLLMGAAGTHAMNEFLYANLGFDPDRDFEPIVATVVIPMMISVHPSLDVKNVAELLALARSRPGKVDVAVPSVTARLVLETLRQSNAPLFGVPYRGSADAATAVIGNQVPVLIDTVAATRPQIGKLRPLAVTSAKTMGALPTVKSVAEQGIPGFEVVAWNALMVPAGTPAAVKDRLAAAMRKILALPETAKAMQDMGFDPAPAMSVAETQAWIRASRRKFGEAIRMAGVKAE